MRKKSLLICLAGMLMARAVSGQQKAPTAREVTPFTVAVPTAAPRPDRWTTLICHFDKPDSFDADFAGLKPRAGGFFEEARAGRPGKFGNAVFIEPEWGLLAYYGRANVNIPMGSADFWIKSAVGRNIWKDGRNHYLLGIHATGWGAPELLLLKTKQDALQLKYIGPYEEPRPLLPRLDVSCAALAADKWHHVFVSWDTRMNAVWLAIDGKGKSAKMPSASNAQPGEALALYLGGKRYAYHLRETADAFIDELRVTCRSAGWIEQHPPKSIEQETGFSDDLLARMTQRVRRHHRFHVAEQRFGGWGGVHWPFRGRKGQYWARTWTPQGTVVRLGKAHQGTALFAALLLMSYEATGEQWYYDAAAKTGEMFLLTQSKKGWWQAWDLKVTPAGLKYDLPPRSPRTDWMHVLVNLDDLTQAKAMFLLCYLYRLSGDKRFLDGAVRSADFICRTQNPNGGWGHLWNIAAQRTMGSSGMRWEASEFEDSAFTGAFYQMLVIHRYTGDEKYLKAALRGADWATSAQLKGATRGWAEQYDKDNVPAWGRPFEPPSCSMVAVKEACEGLLAAWFITRDDKYLAPIASCVKWARSVKHRKGNMFHWTYDVKTGRPIAAFNNKTYFMDDQAQLAAYGKATPRTQRGAMIKEFDIEHWTRTLKQARAGTLKPHCAFATREDVVKFLRSRRAKPMEGVVGNLRAAAILKGEIPFRPTLCTFSGDWREWRDWPFWAYPYPDLYGKSAAARPRTK